MKCSNCGAESEPSNEKHWRAVTVTVTAVPPRVSPSKKIQDVLCPLCALEADNAMKGKRPDATHQ